VHLHFDPPAGPLVILMGVVAGDQPCASPFHLHFDPPAGPLVILMGVVAGDQPCASPFSWAHAASWNRRKYLNWKYLFLDGLVSILLNINYF